MIVKLFDLQNGKIVPSEHCYTMGTLKNIMDKYPEDYLKIYQFLFYMTCPDPDSNPFFHVPQADKEILIFNELDAEFSTEDELIRRALGFCETLYETPIKRAYDGISKALDRIATYMAVTQITDGKDGNIGQVRAMAKDFESIRQSFKGAYKDLQDEQKSRIRGGGSMAYDQK
jgi:hypothetical protein|tara:strand:- start:207 stop:725 length:519 start_codon:yes stop_codon:yes gene_type:complete